MPLVRYGQEELDEAMAKLQADPSCTHLLEPLKAEEVLQRPELEPQQFVSVPPPNPQLQGKEKGSSLGPNFPVNFPAPWLERGCHSQKPPKESIPSESAAVVSPLNMSQGFTSDFHHMYLQSYLRINGGRTHLMVPGDGDCMYSSIRRQLQAPAQYSNLYLRRQISMFLLQEHATMFPILAREIGTTYGVEGDPLGPFSYLGFVHQVSQLGFWGDQVVLKALSHLWGITITILLLPDCTEVRLRHNREMAAVDLVLVLSGQHYTSAGK